MSRELGNVDDQLIQMMNSALNERDRLFGVFVVRVLTQHLYAEPDTPEGILDFVRELRRSRTDRRQGLAASQRNLGFRRLSHIDQRQNLSVLSIDFQRRRVDIE